MVHAITGSGGIKHLTPFICKDLKSLECGKPTANLKNSQGYSVMKVLNLPKSKRFPIGKKFKILAWRENIESAEIWLEEYKKGNNPPQYTD